MLEPDRVQRIHDNIQKDDRNERRVEDKKGCLDTGETDQYAICRHRKNAATSNRSMPLHGMQTVLLPVENVVENIDHTSSNAEGSERGKGCDNRCLHE